jgi:hypothetical protein
MTATELIELWIAGLEGEQARLIDTRHDASVTASHARLIKTIGGLHLYEFTLPADVMLSIDLPVSIIPVDEADTTEGIVLQQIGNRLLVQLVDTLGSEVSSVTLVPDQTGLVSALVGRLKDMLAKPDLYHLGPAERVASLLQMHPVEAETFSSASALLTTMWSDDRLRRRHKLGNLAMELIRANKRILLISPDHQACDEMAGIVGRTMKASGLNHKTWITRYELPVVSQADGVDLDELGFEAQMHQFYAKSQGDKASLKHKYDRFRELVPLLSQKAAKQKDLDEVRSLEWRLTTQVRDLQIRMVEAQKLLEEFEKLPLFQRLMMQVVGKNTDSLKQYRALYQRQIDHLDKELDTAKARIQQLVPEAAVPRGTRAEFDELKEHITKLGGIRKVRELLAAEESPSRQAFLQNRRVVAVTPTRVASDPLFCRVRFDILMVDEAPRVAAPSLLATAGLVRERIIVSGDPREIAPLGQWAMPQSAIRAGR